MPARKTKAASKSASSDAEVSDNEKKTTTKGAAKKATDKKTTKAADKSETKTRSSTKKATKESKSKDSKKEAPKKDDEKEEKTISVEHGQFDKVLEHFSVSLLKELLECNGEKKTKKSAAKKALIQDVLSVAEKKGLANFYAVLGKDEMKAALTTINNEEPDHNSKSKFLTDIKKYVSDNTVDKLFGALDQDTLVKFCACLSFEEENASKAELESALKEEITIAGLRDIFESTNKAYMVDVAKCLGLPHTGTKKKIENSVLGLAYSDALEENEEEEEKKKKAKEDKNSETTDITKINKDSTSDDLYQYYQANLVDYCKQEKLKVTGSKKELVQRIIKYLKDPEDKSVRPQQPGDKKKKKKKSEAQKKKERKDAAKKRADEKAGESSGDDKKSDDKKADDKKSDDKKATEDKKAADKEKKAEEKKAVADKKAEEKKAAADKKAEEKKAAEEKKDESKTDDKKDDNKRTSGRTKKK